MLEALTAQNAQNIIKSDSTVYDPPLKKLIVLPDATGGDVTIKNERDQPVVIKVDGTLTAPIVVDGRVRQVVSTGTTMDDDYILGIR